MDLRKVRRETNLTSILFSKASGRRIPLSGTFELSPICNFSCNMCYVRKTLQEVEGHNRPMMKKEQWLKLAKEARDQGMLYLLLTGGEPFLWTDFWDLYEELTKMGFVISINTNGSLIDKATIERLKENVPSRINITLYGASDQTYKALCHRENMFTRVDQVIRDLMEARIPVKLNCSLTPQNAHDLEKILQYAEMKDLILSVNTYMFPPVRRDEKSVGCNDRFTPEEEVEFHLKRYRLQAGEDQYEQFMRNVLKGSISPPGLDEGCIDPMDGKIRCRAGKASFWVTWDGWMTPCGMMPEPHIDIFKQSFSEAWNDLVDICEKVRLSRVCMECPNQELCHACAAMALAETGTTKGVPKYLCQTVKSMRKRAEEYIYKNKDLGGIYDEKV